MPKSKKIKVKADLEGVQARIGYTFKDPSLLEYALTHGSATNFNSSRGQNYQRLEFLGDRVLGLLVATMLHNEYPYADEGELASRYNHLVRNETCAEIAEELNLGNAVAVAAGLSRAGGRNAQALLADLCESLLAALYIDAGFETVKEFVWKHWHVRMRAYVKPRRDAKSTMNEFAQSKGLEHPVFEVTDKQGPPHSPVFTVCMSFTGFQSTVGVGNSKAAAEQIAAEQFLIREQIWTED